MWAHGRHNAGGLAATAASPPTHPHPLATCAQDQQALALLLAMQAQDSTLNSRQATQQVRAAQ